MISTTTVVPNTVKAWKNPTAQFTLTHDDVDDAHPGSWVLRCFVGDTTNGVDAITMHVWVAPMTSGEAMCAAIDLLYRHQVRITGWRDGKHRDQYIAAVGPTHDSWRVTQYSGRGGVLWRRNADGSWTGAGGSRYGSEDLLRRRQGPLTPVAVHNLAGLVAELEIYRQTASYLDGPDACADGECEEYDDLPPGVMCSHLEIRIATGRQMVALERVVDLLADLEADATPNEAFIVTGRYSNGDLTDMEAVRRTVTSIRELIREYE